MRKAIIAILLGLVAMGGGIGQYGVSGGGGSAYSPTLTLPDTAYVAYGRQFDLRHDQMGQRNIYGPPELKWISSCGTMTYSAFASLDSSARLTAGAGSYGERADLVLTGVDANGATQRTLSTVVRMIPKEAGTDSARVLFIGDSMLAGHGGAAISPPEDATVGEVYRLSRVDGGTYGNGHFLPIGTQGSAPHKHEAVDSRRWADMVGAGVFAANPFWEGGRNDFQHYLTHNSLAAPKFVVVSLGANDVGYGLLMEGYSYWDDAAVATRVAYIDAFIAALNDPTYGIPSAQILLVTEPIGSGSTEGYRTTDYLTAGNSGSWTMFLANMNKLNKAIIDRYSSRRYASNVHVCAAHLWVDRHNGYPMALANVSSRSTIQRRGFTQWVHPGQSGYEQWTDAIYSHLKYLWAATPTGATGNILVNSTDFAHASWTLIGNATQTTAIDGPLGGTGNAQVWVNGSATFNYFTTAGTRPMQWGRINVLSCYFKATTGTIRPALSIGGYYLIWTQTTGGAVTLDSQLPVNYYTSGGGAWGYTDVGSGWVRVWIYRPNADWTNEGLRVTAEVWTKPGGTSTGVNTAVFGAQFEQGVTTPSAYSARP
jgi:lysophospholipase L1-like esterase